MSNINMNSSNDARVHISFLAFVITQNLLALASSTLATIVACFKHNLPWNTFWNPIINSLLVVTAISILASGSLIIVLMPFVSGGMRKRAIDKLFDKMGIIFFFISLSFGALVAQMTVNFKGAFFWNWVE